MNLYEKILSLFYRVVKNDRRILYYTELSKNLNLNRNGLTNYDETKKKIKNSLDAYYSTNKYYLSCITKLFHSSSFTLKLKQVNFIIKKKIHKYYLQTSN